RRARGACARGVQSLAAGVLRVAQASRHVALLRPVRSAAARRRGARGRVACDLAALAVAAAVGIARAAPRGGGMIIQSLLDTDLYKFTMMQAVLHQHPGAQ